MGKLNEDGTITTKEWLLATKANFITSNTILLEFIDDLVLDLQTRLKKKNPKKVGGPFKKLYLWTSSFTRLASPPQNGSVNIVLGHV